MNLEQGFRILGLGCADDSETGRRAWRTLVRRWHPDRFAQNPAMRTLAEERLKEINRAWTLVAPHLPPAPRRPDGKGQKADRVTDDEARASLRPGLKRLLRRIRLRRILREIFSVSGGSSPAARQDPLGGAKQRKRARKGKSFDEVFEEVSGAGPSVSQPDPGASTARPARPFTARHRPAGDAGTVGGINGVEGVDPVDAPGRPGRVRGIGRDR